MDELQPQPQPQPAQVSPQVEPIAPAEVNQPSSIGVPAPEGHTGPWPRPGMDGGNPASWLEQ